MSEAFLVASHGPCSHYHAYGEKSHDLVGDIVQTASTDEDCADGIDKIVHGVNVCGEVCGMRHGACRCEQAAEQQHADDKEPHHEDGLLHGVTIVGYDESETAPEECQQHCQDEN